MHAPVVPGIEDKNESYTHIDDHDENFVNAVNDPGNPLYRVKAVFNGHTHMGPIFCNVKMASSYKKIDEPAKIFNKNFDRIMNEEIPYYIDGDSSI